MNLIPIITLISLSSEDYGNKNTFIFKIIRVFDYTDFIHYYRRYSRHYLQKDAASFKPLGDIFLNLLFTVLIPLVFFSISSAVAGMQNIRRLGKIMSAMILVFVVTGLIASVVMIIGVVSYPPASGVHVNPGNGINVEHLKISDQIVKAFTVSDFADLLSKKNMLALIIFQF